MSQTQVIPAMLKESSNGIEKRYSDNSGEDKVSESEESNISEDQSPASNPLLRMWKTENSPSDTSPTKKPTLKNSPKSRLFDYRNQEEPKFHFRHSGSEGPASESFNTEPGTVTFPKGKRTQDISEPESPESDDGYPVASLPHDLRAKKACIDAFMKSCSSTKGITVKTKASEYKVEKTTLWSTDSKVSNHECEMFIKKNFSHIPWISPSVLGIKCPDLQLHNEIVEFYKVFGPNAKEMQKRAKCFSTIKKAIVKFVRSKDTFSPTDCKVRIFGSTCTNLYINSNVRWYYRLSSSDIDIVVKGKTQLSDIHTALEEEFANFKGCSVINASVSIIKGTDRKTGLDFDIAVNEDDGIKGSKIINEFKKEFSELKYLVTILKILLSIHDLNKTYDGGINSFGLILLVVSYLQQQRMMKPQGGEEPEKKTLLSNHLLNFFKLYGYDFNYEQVGISVRKDGFYYQRDDKNFDNGTMPKAFLSLENPGDPSLNVAKSAHQFCKVQELFRRCYNKIVEPRKISDVSILNLIIPTVLYPTTT